MAKRQIVLDTETTGLDARTERLIEIGCVELIDGQLSGQDYHCYIRPDRPVSSGAFQVHGISNQFLADKPPFAEIVDEFIDYIRGAELIIHNAPFDLGFINAELERLGRDDRVEDYCTVIDSLALARKKHPKQKNRLDDLCQRYGIDNQHRQKHGALLDAQILAEVYLKMTAAQTEILFYILPAQQNCLSFTVKLAQKILSLQRRLLILAPRSDLEQLDRLLWTQYQQSFIPHGYIEQADPQLNPILLSEGHLGDEKDILLNLSAEIPAEFQRFQRLIECVDSQNKVVRREHYRFYQQQGYEISTHQL